MKRGLTLIEMTVALAIIALLFGAAVVGVGALTGTKAKAATGEIAAVIRSMYDRAALSGNTCRVVFDLPDPKDEDGVVTYRAECAAGSLTTRRDRDDELKEVTEQKKREEREAERGQKPERSRLQALSDSEPTMQEILAGEKLRIEAQATYSDFGSAEVAARALPAAVRVSVWTRHQQAQVSSGTARLYFFPSGYTEKAHVYVRQGDNVWTISVSPLTGKTVVVAEELEVPRS